MYVLAFASPTDALLAARKQITLDKITKKPAIKQAFHMTKYQSKGKRLFC
ncbi:hypothetical protein A6A12_1793 [Vibrio anguillarum]|nr:hypothetical protein A6A12_1793 [Vibrio anguillarum]